MGRDQEARRRIIYDVDINLLPEEYRRKPVSRKPLAVAILVFSAVCMIRLVTLNVEGEALLAANEARLAESRAEVNRIQREMGDWKQLSSELEAKKKQEKALQDSIAVIDKKRSGWASILRSILDQAGREVALESATGANGVVRLLGMASNLDTALKFARALEQSGSFARVTLVSYSTKPISTSKAAGGGVSPSASVSDSAVSFELVADVRVP